LRARNPTQILRPRLEAIMSEQPVLSLQKSLIGTCALAAIIVFASFCSVVNGAVDRASRHRLAVADSALQSTSPQPHANTARSTATVRSTALLARIGN
jgi:hypothetical protein